MNKRLSLFQAVKRGFSVGLDNAHVLVPTTLLFLASVALVGAASFLALLNAGPVKTLIEGLKGASPEVIQQTVLHFLANNTGVLANLGLALLLVVIVSCWLGVGFFRVMFDVNDAGNSYVSRLFSGSFKTTLKVFFAFILLMFAFLSGLMLFVVPGIYFIVRFMFVLYFIIDKDAGIIESFKLSWHATQGQFWTLSGLAIVMTVVSSAVYLTPVAWLLASPLSGLIGIAFYRQLIQEGDADEQKQIQGATE